MSDFHVLVIFNDRLSTWVDVASSFDRAKLDDLVRYLEMAGCLAEVVCCADDTEAVISFVVDNLPAPPGSFAAGVAAMEDEAVRLTAPPVAGRRRRLSS